MKPLLSEKIKLRQELSVWECDMMPPTTLSSTAMGCMYMPPRSKGFNKYNKGICRTLSDGGAHIYSQKLFKRYPRISIVWNWN